MDDIDLPLMLISLTPADGGSQIAVSCRSGRNLKRYLLLAEDFAGISGELVPGNPVDPGTAELLSEFDGRCRALLRGRSLLEYRSNSRRGLSMKLRKKGFASSEAQFAAERLEAEGAIDEKRDVLRETERQIAAGRGRKRIVSALFAMGYGADAVGKANELLDSTDFSENCRRIIEKKWGSLPSEPDARRKAVSALFRLGFSAEDIKKAARR